MIARLLRAALLCLPFAIVACAGGANDAGGGDEQDIKRATGNKEGEICGGIAGLRCQAGLDCAMSGPTHPDQSGVCSKPVLPPVHCQAIPACDPGFQAVPKCDDGDKTCTSKSMCGRTIFCAQPKIHCQAFPACSSGDVQVEKCDAADKDCAPLTMCGDTIFCTKPKFQCQAIPACSGDDVQVEKCDAADKDCAPLSMCGHTIFCTKSK